MNKAVALEELIRFCEERNLSELASGLRQDLAKAAPTAT